MVLKMNLVRRWIKADMHSLQCERAMGMTQKFKIGFGSDLMDNPERWTILLALFQCALGVMLETRMVTAFASLNKGLERD